MATFWKIRHQSTGDQFKSRATLFCVKIPGSRLWRVLPQRARVPASFTSKCASPCQPEIAPEYYFHLAKSGSPCRDTRRTGRWPLPRLPTWERTSKGAAHHGIGHVVCALLAVLTWGKYKRLREARD